MPSSNILKGDREGVLRFDFDEIRTRSPGAASGMGTGGTAERGSANDPGEGAEQLQAEEERLREIEEGIRTRLMEAERRAEEMEKAAYEKGYAQGQKDGFEYGQKSAQIVKDHLEQLLKSLGALPRKVLNDYRDWLLKTCLDISRRLVQEGGNSRPDALMKLIDGLVHEAEPHPSLTLYLNSKDHENLKKYTEFQSWIEGLRGSLSVRSDPAVSPGGALLESDLQYLDATLETQFVILEEALRSVAQQGADGTAESDGGEDKERG